MHAKVLKPFRYSPEGFGGKLLSAGEQVDLRADLAQGLVDEGFVEAAGLKANPKPPAKEGDGPDGAHEVEIPDGWQDLDWPELQKLAASLTDSKIKNKKDAVAAIELELANREKAQD